MTMYLPRSFEEKRLPLLRQIMHEHSFATLIVHTRSGPEAAHIPFEWVDDPVPLGTLRAHLARPNPLWREFDPAFEALVVFHGPHAYISPDWYPGSKAHGREVPTWNYVTVHARGPLRIIDDPAWLRTLLERQVSHHEAGRTTPWAMDDAPADFIDDQLRYIIGIEIPLKSLTGKVKASQNRTPAERAGVEAGLRAEGGEAEAAMADIVRRSIARPHQGIVE
jgi:transcriptional regulator